MPKDLLSAVRAEDDDDDAAARLEEDASVVVESAETKGAAKRSFRLASRW